MAIPAPHHLNPAAAKETQKARSRVGARIDLRGVQGLVLSGERVVTWGIPLSKGKVFQGGPSDRDPFSTHPKPH